MYAYYVGVQFFMFAQSNLKAISGFGGCIHFTTNTQFSGKFVNYDSEMVNIKTPYFNSCCSKMKAPLGKFKFKKVVSKSIAWILPNFSHSIAAESTTFA